MSKIVDNLCDEYIKTFNPPEFCTTEGCELHPPGTRYTRKEKMLNIIHALSQENRGLKMTIALLTATAPKASDAEKEEML